MSTPTNFTIPTNPRFEIVSQSEEIVEQHHVTVKARFIFLDGTDATIDVALMNPDGSAYVQQSLENRFISELRQRFGLNPDGTAYVEPSGD